MTRGWQGVLFGAAGGLVALLAERVTLPPLAVVEVDLGAVVTEHVRRPDVMTLPASDRAREAARFAARLEQETARLAGEYHAVVLAAPAVVAGVPDLTGVLRQRLDAQTP